MKPRARARQAYCGRRFRQVNEHKLRASRRARFVMHGHRHSRGVTWSACAGEGDDMTVSPRRFGSV